MFSFCGNAGRAAAGWCCFVIAAGLPFFFFSFPAQAKGGSSAAYPVAMRSFGVWETATEERFDFSVWFPGKASSVPGTHEGWLVTNARNGRIIPGFYPVILLSHDTASSRFANNDLASALAAGGMIVIAPMHSGDNQNNSDAIYSLDSIRSRPRELLRALETVLASPIFAPYADESRIGLLGVGFGTITVLQLAGAKPDFSLFATDEGRELCSRASRVDAFCAPWAQDRLARLAVGMHLSERNEGGEAATPPLALYAPPLMAVALPAPEEASALAESSRMENRKEPSLMEKLFSWIREEQPAQTEASAPDVLDADSGQESPGANPTADPLPPSLNFQGGSLFGGTDSGSSFVQLAMPDSPPERMAATEDNVDAIAASLLLPAKGKALVFQRPAATRKIRAVALMLPAGGALFSQEVLSSIHMPIAVLQAEKDEIYPPDRHAQPYVLSLPVPPQIMNLADADHFSLFAPCASELSASLDDVCGRMTERARLEVNVQRDNFIISFFQAILGGALPPAEPSGFVAVSSER